MLSKEWSYALVKVTDEEIFLFATWNGHYCIIEKETGRIFTKGVGDDLLGKYDGLLPIKLLFWLGRSTGYLQTGEK